MTAADEVRQIAALHHVEVRHDARAYRLAVAVNRLEGGEADETLDLIAALSRDGHIKEDHAFDLTQRHYYELHPDRAPGLHDEIQDQQVHYGMGSIR